MLQIRIDLKRRIDMYPNGFLPEMLLKMIQEENERLIYEIHIQSLVKRGAQQSIFVKITNFLKPAKNNPPAAMTKKPSTRYESVDCMQVLTPCS